MGDAIKYLYSQFILRDVLSFITPGAVVVWTALHLFYPDLLKQPIHWLFYIPIFGILYVIGFAAQCLGEMFGMRMKREMKSTWKQRWNILKPSNWDDEANIWWKEAFKRDYDFFNVTVHNEGAKQGRERLVVLKQMCGNIFVACIIAGVLLIVGNRTDCGWYLLIVGVPLFISLIWGQRVHLLRQWSREEVFRERNSQVSQ